MWMVTTDDKGVVKYWQSNMNNVHSFQAHNETIRGCRWETRESSPRTLSSSDSIACDSNFMHCALFCIRECLCFVPLCLLLYVMRVFLRKEGTQFHQKKGFYEGKGKKKGLKCL